MWLFQLSKKLFVFYFISIAECRNIAKWQLIVPYSITYGSRSKNNYVTEV